MAKAALGRGTRAVWGVADQFLSALSNACMTFAGAHLLAARDFGVYALLFTAVTITIGLARALTSEVYTVLMATAARPERARGQSQAVGASAVLGIVAGVVGVVVALLLGLPAASAFGVACIPVLVQDTIRFLLVSEGRVRSAFINDAVWVTVQFGALVAIVLAGQHSIAALALTWALGALAAVLVGLWQLGVPFTLRGTREWFDKTRSYSGYYVLEFAALAGSGYSIVYVVALIAGVNGAGAYRGAQAIFGPVTSLIGGLRMVALPAIVRMREEGRSRVIRTSMGFAAAVFAASAVITLAIWGLQDWVVPLLLGATAASAVPLIIPMGLGRAFSSASSGPLLGLRALGATRRSLATRATLSLATVLAAAIGAWLGGASGAAWGFALASGVGMAAWTVMLRRQELLIPATERTS